MKALIALFAVSCIILQGTHAGFDDEIQIVRAGKTESDLRRDLFQNYDKLVRPSNTPSAAVPVWVGLSPLYLKTMDEQNGRIEMDSWIMMKWKDDNLRWDPAQYGGIGSLNLPVSEVWKPDLTLYTGLPGTSLPEVETQVVIFNNSDILWVPPFVVNSRCPLQSDKAPRKIVQCNLQIGSWTYSGKQLDIQKYAETADLSNFLDTNPDWQLVSVTSDRQSKFYPCCPDDYPVVNFNVTLKRRPSSYKTLTDL